MVKRVTQYKNLLITSDTPIVKAIEIIDRGGIQIALVVDDNNVLLGTVTDGDIRRGILKNISLQGPVREVMNRNPMVALTSASKKELFELLKSNTLRQIPIVDDERRIAGVSTLSDFFEEQPKDNWVLLMAGGLGSRLYPLTKDLPKPMLKVGSTPILEQIIQSFKAQGYSRFLISVNYKAEVVKDHFGNGTRHGVEIRYLEESSSLGTAGCLSLIQEKLSLPLIVMNGDVLTKVNFNQLLEYHLEQGALATMCVREYEFQVPFGVVTLDDKRHQITSIDEKPTHRFFVNGGIYVLSPEAVKRVPSNQRYDMTTLFSSLTDSGLPVSAFPVREYWLDIGRLDDFEKANADGS